MRSVYEALAGLPVITWLHAASTEKMIAGMLDDNAEYQKLVEIVVSDEASLLCLQAEVVAHLSFHEGQRHPDDMVFVAAMHLFFSLSPCRPVTPRHTGGLGWNCIGRVILQTPREHTPWAHRYANYLLREENS